MRRPVGLVRVAAVVAAGWACAPVIPQPPDPFAAPRAMVLARLGRVVLTPVVAPSDVLAAPQALSRIDLALEVALPAAGVPVVSAREYGAVWERILRQTGGFFDPFTGARDERKFERAREMLLDELDGRYGTRTLVYPELRYVDADVSDYVARWDGVSQSLVDGDGALDSALAMTFDGEAGGDGVVTVLSLLVTIEAPDGEVWYTGFGGLEVLAGVGSEDRPLFALQAHTERVSRAVDIAVRPLADSARAGVSPPRAAVPRHDP